VRFLTSRSTSPRQKATGRRESSMPPRKSVDPDLTVANAEAKVVSFEVVNMRRVSRIRGPIQGVAWGRLADPTVVQSPPGKAAELA
jgi:hypothetical protein